MHIYYFDNSATTKVKEEVLNEMIPFFCFEYGNPSSLYTLGRKAKKAIEESREKVANLIGADKKEIYFTSGGTESDNTAIKGIANALKDRGKHIITSKIEHPAVLDSCKVLEKQGYKITYVNVDSEGKIKLDELANSITDETILISIMFANNEIGTIQDIEKISHIAKSKNIIFHTDAVQAVGNVKIDVKKMNVDMLSMSGHKIYGPKGIGGLYVKKGIEFEKFMNGGHQEQNKRAGTENVVGIVGLGKACELANKNLDKHIKYVQELRDYFFSEIQKRIKSIKINGSLTDRLPCNANVSFQGVDAQELLFKLDSKGICASSGSACSSRDSNPSHVLTAIGLDSGLVKGALRVTFGDFNCKEEVDYLVDNLVKFI